MQRRSDSGKCFLLVNSAVSLFLTRILHRPSSSSLKRKPAMAESQTMPSHTRGGFEQPLPLETWCKSSELASLAVLLANE